MAWAFDGRLIAALLLAALGACSASSNGSAPPLPSSSPTPPASGSTTTNGITGATPPRANGSAGASVNASANAPMTGSAGNKAQATPPASTGMGSAGTPAVATGGKAGAGTAGTPASTVPATPHGSSTCLKAGDGTYGEPGPYQVAMMDVDLGMGMDICPNQTTSKYTIFYPNPLETSCPHPIVAWGNGTGVNSDSLDAYSFFSKNAASWGVVVIAAHDPNSGCGNYHKVGIDYLLAQNADPTSMFYQKLSTRAGVAGHSQGGIGATAGSQHPNVEAEVSVAGGGVPKDKIAFICLTGTMDMVEGPCTASYMAATGPAFLADWMNGDHTTTETIAGYFSGDPGTRQMERLYAAWFRCWLGDDQTACALFKGAPDGCGICKDTGWAKHESRNM